MNGFRRNYQSNDTNNSPGKYDPTGTQKTSPPKPANYSVPVETGERRNSFRNFAKVLSQKRIDDLLMESHLAKDLAIPTTISYEDARGIQRSISRQDMADRLTHKIKVAKESGTMDNEQYQNYLYSSAERLNMDMCIFDSVITV